ncbi:DUF6527 family protein [Sphingobacterium sp. SGG-5]|uniref:DUF6527 family protein n=1 Tax=Sphingobacterium sp. SGG-5 TaxID=2710881 RepID=UPI0019D0C85C|nr:DUF6527 family protein [Sphingobacterium sp. SGG-5]
MILQHRFVEFIPDTIEEGAIYISFQYCTAIHKCVCGCGNEVVTPLSPTDWELTFNGKNISLYPSIGNWSFECQSHYWIRKNKIKHADKWGSSEIMNNREGDRNSKDIYYSDNNVLVEEQIAPLNSKKDKISGWARFKNFISNLIKKRKEV